MLCWKSTFVPTTQVILTEKAHGVLFHHFCPFYVKELKQAEEK